MSRLDSARITRAAVEKCLAGRAPRDLEPGRYTAILEPTAAGMLLSRLLEHLEARDADEGHSFFSKPGGGNRIGEALFDARVTIESDPGDSRRRGGAVRSRRRSAARSGALGRARRAAPAGHLALLGARARRRRDGATRQPGAVGRRRARSRRADRLDRARRPDHAVLVHPRPQPAHHVLHRPHARRHVPDRGRQGGRARSTASASTSRSPTCCATSTPPGAPSEWPPASRARWGCRSWRRRCGCASSIWPAAATRCDPRVDRSADPARRGAA